ncbi:hypothetical protein [Neogemmobacter tilapiae]|uniref:Uncharacterized protein n=1 Tax=Neogemmobacter tilapiae TaxID=875041 RepID=A0A918TKR4_9RHOB|nr:hypothetical protein [Gemmobacter tilapiae]GHC50097.1 hypothetical protein GCM10007315_10370 [Gemmobacter tilapiae]
MLRKTLILAAVLMASAHAGQAVAEAFYAPYEILADHPDCGGPGKIAFRVSYEAQADVTFPYAAGEAACVIKERKGGELFEYQVNCPAGMDDLPSASNGSLGTPPVLGISEKAAIQGRIELCMGVSESSVLSSLAEVTFDLPAGKKTSVTLNDESPLAIRLKDRWIYANQKPDISGAPPFLFTVNMLPVEVPFETMGDDTVNVILSFSLMLKEQNIQSCQAGGEECFGPVNGRDGSMLQKHFDYFGIENDFGLGACSQEEEQYIPLECPQ